MTYIDDITHDLLDLAARAEAIARSLDQRIVVRHGGRVGMTSVEQPSRTTGIPAPNSAAMVSLAQVCQACRDFRNSVEAAVAALPKETWDSIDAIEVTRPSSRA
jgi:hypothetical protein